MPFPISVRLLTVCVTWSCVVPVSSEACCWTAITRACAAVRTFSVSDDWSPSNICCPPINAWLIPSSRLLCAASACCRAVVSACSMLSSVAACNCRSASRACVAVPWTDSMSRALPWSA